MYVCLSHDWQKYTDTSSDESYSMADVFFALFVLQFYQVFELISVWRICIRIYPCLFVWFPSAIRV